MPFLSLKRLLQPRQTLRWPLPAVLVWLACWLLLRGLLALGLTRALALALVSGLGLLAALWTPRWWRRALVAAGFPLSALLSLGGLGSVPTLLWLTALLLLLLLYPVRAWRDAPLFPTPADALQGLPGYASLAPGGRVLDAGCGLGHGLRALRRAYPQAQLSGLEWSWPLWAWCALRCPWAQVRRGDFWRSDWSDYDLVYLFQRPESMPRALAKARAELRPGAWLVSLAFEVPTVQSRVHYRTSGGKMVWVYQAPFNPTAGV